MVDMTALMNFDTAAARKPQLADGNYSVTNLGYKVEDSRFNEGGLVVVIETRITDSRQKIFKRFEVDTRKINSFFYLNLYVDSCGVNRSGKCFGEFMPELVGTEAVLNVSTRLGKADPLTGERREYQDVKIVIDGKPVFEARED